MEKNYIRQPVVILIGSLFLLYLLSFLHYEYTIAGFTFRNVDFFMDVKHDAADEEFSRNSRVAIEPQALFAGFDFLKPLEFFAAEKDNANYAY
jgi:hypothetical protein